MIIIRGYLYDAKHKLTDVFECQMNDKFPRQLTRQDGKLKELLNSVVVDGMINALQSSGWLTLRLYEKE